MSRPPRILATICLNEEEFIGAWLSYHYRVFDHIILCEGAARDYPRVAVTDDGLSADRTAKLIRAFPDPEGKIAFVQHGWAGPEHNPNDSVPAKMELRNRYAALIDEGYVFTLDIDEFLCPDHVEQLIAVMEEHPDVPACQVPFLHLWQDGSQYITGGFADITHVRLYRWPHGARYVSSHNWPSAPGGRSLAETCLRMPLQVHNGVLAGPAVMHLGFCKPKPSMLVKNYYYVMRGEYRSRPLTTEFRAAAFAGRVPEGCTVHPYRGFPPPTADRAHVRHSRLGSARHSGEATHAGAGSPDAPVAAGSRPRDSP